MGNFECFSNLLSPIIQLKTSLLKLPLKFNAFPYSNEYWLHIQPVISLSNYALYIDNRFVFDKVSHITLVEIKHDFCGKGFKDNSC